MTALEEDRCAGISAHNGKRCRQMGRAKDDGPFLCRHHRPLEVGLPRGGVDHADAALALLEQRRAERELAARAREQAEQAYREAAATSNRGDGAHGRRRLGLVDLDAGGDR